MPTKCKLPGLWPGLILITVGAGLLAREFGLLPPSVRLIDFWPLLVLLLGISGLLRASGFVGALFALAFVAAGGLLLAGNLGFLAFPAARLWPALLVLLGLAFLFRGRAAARPDPQADPASPEVEGASDASRPPHYARYQEQSTEEDRLVKQFTASGAQLRIESQAWRGGELGVTAGGVEIDLRNARLHPDGALLDVRVMMGGIEIRVPDTWQVQCEVTPLFGGADNETRSTQGSTTAPKLRVIGTVTLGGINIRN